MSTRKRANRSSIGEVNWWNRERATSMLGSKTRRLTSLYRGLRNLDSANQNFFQKRSVHPNSKSRCNGHNYVACPHRASLVSN